MRNHDDDRAAELLRVANQQSLRAQCEAHREQRLYAPYFARVALQELKPEPAPNSRPEPVAA